MFSQSFWSRGSVCVVAVAGRRRSGSRGVVGQRCVGGALCLGCWHVQDDLASLGAVAAGGRLMLEVRGWTLSALR